MNEISHRVKVFVFRCEEDSVQYLMLLGKPRQESFWGPVQGTIQPWENAQKAVLREVHEGTGLSQPQELIDLDLRNVWSVGGSHLVDWTYGFRIHSTEDGVSPGAQVSDYRWEPFPEAFEKLEEEFNRKAVLRLQTMLQGF